MSHDQNISTPLEQLKDCVSLTNYSCLRHPLVKSHTVQHFVKLLKNYVRDQRQVKYSKFLGSCSALRNFPGVFDTLHRLVLDCYERSGDFIMASPTALQDKLNGVELPAAADMHVHLRDGEMTRLIVYVHP